MLDANPRSKRARHVVLGAIAIGIFSSVPWVGWWLVLLLAGGAAPLIGLDARIARSPTPERHIVFAIAVVQVLMLVVVGATGGTHSPMLAWQVIPLGLSAARFRTQVVAAHGVIVAIAASVVCLATDAHRVAADPVPLIMLVVMLISMSAICHAIIEGEMSSRADATVDALTGLLNRAAYERRAAEIEHQVHQTGAPVAALMCDIDHFKTINDRYGHETGDAVLRDAAHAMRLALREFDFIYRFGGEEFVVLLPGRDAHAACEVGERLRVSVSEAQPGGLDVTVSVGVGADIGLPGGVGGLVRAADDALYRAKAAGRDRVETATFPAPALAVA